MLLLFKTKGCKPCEQLESLLKTRSITYTAFFVEDYVELSELLQIRSVPFLVRLEVLAAGFQPGKIQDVIVNL